MSGSCSSTSLVLIAPWCDGTDVGEAWSTFQWVRRLGERFKVTVLTCQRLGRASLAEQLPGLRIVEWPDLRMPSRWFRFGSMAKPGYLLFYWRCRKWLKRRLACGERFAIGHQLSPLALRYPSPLSGLGIPYVVGPLGGSIPTPVGFEQEMRGSALYTRLRALDRVRLRLDPWMRDSLEGAALVIGVAPYVRDLLGRLQVRRFEVMSETGVERLPELTRPPRKVGEPLRLLFVGRMVRSKGARDAIRATAILARRMDVTLTLVGDGEDRRACEEEAEQLGVRSRVSFVGRIPRSSVDDFYRAADLFLFPSLREPSGNAVFEAMSYGLPVVACASGGPGYVVDRTCGQTVVPCSPDRYAKDLASAVCGLVSRPAWREALGEGARRRIAQLALWEHKIAKVSGWYTEIAAARPDSARVPDSGLRPAVTHTG